MNIMKNRLKLKEKKVIQGLIIFCMFAVITISLFGDKGFLQLLALRDQQQRLEGDIMDLTRKRKEWIQKIQSLKTDQGYLETIAREKLGMVRKDELIIKIEPEKDPF